MKGRTRLAPALIVLILCAVLVLAVVQGLGDSSLRSAARPLESPIDKVPPTVAAPAVEVTSELDQALATLAVESTATAQARPPTATPGAIVGPKRIFDSFNHVSLDLPDGWYANVPPNTSDLVAAVTSISSYDFYQNNSTSKLPDDGVSIDIFSGVIPSDRSFEDWVAEQHKLAITPEQGASIGAVESVTDISVYETAGYKGLTFDEIAIDKVRWRVVYLKIDEKNYVAVSMRPINGTTEKNVETATKLIDTLKIQPKAQ